MSSKISQFTSKLGHKINKCLTLKCVNSFDCKICFGDVKIWALCFGGCCGGNDKPASPVITLCSKKETTTENENQMSGRLKGNMKVWFKANHHVWHYYKGVRDNVCWYVNSIQGMKKFNVNPLGAIYVEGNIDLFVVQDALRHLLGTPVIIVVMQMEEDKSKEEMTDKENENRENDR